MGLYADTINKVRDTIVANMVTAQPLEHLKTLYFGEFDAITKWAFPYIWLHIDNPAIDESWIASGTRRESMFRILIGVAVKSPSKEFPYGKTGDVDKRGILTIAVDIMNVIEGERQALIKDMPANIDMGFTIRETSNLGENAFGLILVLTFKQRYFATLR